MKHRVRGQMSESAIVMGLLCVSGGFQDAYTYNCRGKVFANAQTGNMVLLGQNFAGGHWEAGVRYLLPVLAFAAGIFAAEKIHRRFWKMERFHWRQTVILAEAILLFLVGWMGQRANVWANVLVSFVCAMQVQSFRKLNGNAYATTMCIGNLRTATDLFCGYCSTGERHLLHKSLWYYGFIGIFILGASAGVILTGMWEEKAIWVSCGLLLVVFFLMFLKEESQDLSSRTGGREDIEERIQL